MDLHCSLSPNGWKSHDRGQVVLYLEAKSWYQWFASKQIQLEFMCNIKMLKIECKSGSE